MNKIEYLISQIYPTHHTTAIYEEVERLFEKYQELGARKADDLSERDVVLITYGDQLVSDESDNSKLNTLHQFLNKYVKNQISTVHILPFYPSTSDDGFAVKDYYEVDKEMGSWDDIEHFSEHYKLVFDAVINHCSSKSKWFQEFLKGEKKYEKYFIEVDDLTKYKNVVRPRTTPLVHAFKSGEKTVNIWTTFSRDQVDLNYKNPKVLLQILDLLSFYVMKGASIIRLDAIGFLWKEEDTKCIHLPQTHQIIKLIRLYFEQLNSNIKLLTETNVPHAENISYFGHDDEAHMVYNFTLPPLLAYSLLDETSEKFANWVKTLKTPFNDVCYFNFLSSHDGVGVLPVEDILNNDELNVLIESSIANGGKVSYKALPNGQHKPYEINSNYLNLLFGKQKDEQLGIKRTLLAHAVLLTMPGLPAIYFHSLFGSLNDIAGMEQSGQNRRINRQKFTDTELLKELNNSNSRQSFILRFLTKLIDLRKIQEAFNPFNEFEVLSTDPGIFGLLRKARHPRENVWAYFNFTQKPKIITLHPGHQWVDVITGTNFTDNLTLTGLNGAWLKKQ